MDDKRVNKSMIQEELQNRITDAADGMLSREEIIKLEAELQNHPGLEEDYKIIMNLPELSVAYGTEMNFRNDKKAHQLLNKISQIAAQKQSFEKLSLMLFKRYALAASLLILTGATIFNLTQNNYLNDEMAFDELIYPEETSIAEEYVLFLDNWIEP